MKESVGGNCIRGIQIVAVDEHISRAISITGSDRNPFRCVDFPVDDDIVIRLDPNPSVALNHPAIDWSIDQHISGAVGIECFEANKLGSGAYVHANIKSSIKEAGVLITDSNSAPDDRRSIQNSRKVVERIVPNVGSDIPDLYDARTSIQFTEDDFVEAGSDGGQLLSPDIQSGAIETKTKDGAPDTDVSGGIEGADGKI